MRDNSTILRERQATVRRQLDLRGASLKALSFDSGVPYSTLLSYFPQEGAAQPAVLPASALFALCGLIPDDLLSLLLPDGFQIMRVPEGVDHDALADHCREYLSAKDHAHHPDSPDGREISGGESANLSAMPIAINARGGK